MMAGLAWHSVSLEIAQAQVRYQERAEGALDAGQRACAEVLREVIPRVGAEVTSRVVVTPLRIPIPSAAWEAADLRAADLVRAKGPAVAEATLLSFAAEAAAERPADAAAALSAAASLARGDGRLELARARWQEVLDLEAKAGPLYTERELRWSWIAGYQLGRLEIASGQGERLLALLAELSVPDGPFAQESFRQRVLAALSENEKGVAGEVLAPFAGADRRESLRRRLRFGGPSVAELKSYVGAPRTFDLPHDLTRGTLPFAEARVIVVVLEPGKARAMTLADVADYALDRPLLTAYSKLGFELRAVVRGKESAPPTAPVVAQRQLDGIFAGVELQVLGREQEAFLASERRRLRQTLGLIGGALLLLLLGSVFVLRSLLREAETARAQRNFVAAVTHELKTPLASIRLLGELLAEGGVEPEKASEFAGQVVSEADRLSSLVLTVLDLSKVRGGIDLAACEPLAVRALAKDALERQRLAAREAGVSLTLLAEEDLPRVLGDRAGLVGVLTNLVDNSLKYGDASEPVELEVVRAQDQVRFVVRDRGPGVPLAEREQIFEAFHRVQDEMTREQPGVGLGLALARSVAEAHGGSLRYQPRSGGGSEFVLELPAVETRA